MTSLITAPRHRAKLKNNALLFVVVAIMLLTTSLFIYNGYTRISQTYQHISSEINLQNHKRTLMITMYNAARDRSLILLKMLEENDAFELDDMQQELASAARQFIRARKQLVALPLSEQEKVLLAKQQQLTKKNAPLQNQIAEWLINDQHYQAKQLLYRTALPNQTVLLQHISAIFDLYNLDSNSLSAAVKLEFNHSAYYFIIIAIGFFIIILFTMLVIITRMSRKEEKALQSGFLKAEEIAKNLTLSQKKLIQYSDALVTYTAILSIDGKVEMVNKTSVASSGLPLENFIGKKLYDCFWWNYDTTSQQKLKADIEHCLAGKTINREAKIQIVGGAFIYIRFVLTAIKDAQGNITNLVAEGQDITERKQVAEKLNFQASHDDLTGLINRVEFERRLENLLQRCEDEITHFVFYLDLDQFKIVNDTSGHTAGDELLRQVPQSIQSCIRRSDVLARLGGDEFGIILEHCDENSARKIASAILRGINDFQFCWQDKTFRIGVSIGMLKIDNSDITMGDVLKYIDSACYAAKDAGRNCFHLYQPNDVKLIARESEMDWVARIETAVRENQFELYGQVIVPIAKQSSDSFNMELLIRMRDKDGSIIPPGAFLPSAERYHKMLAIDRWVIAEAFSTLSLYPDFLEKVGYCSINLSCQSLTDKRFLDFLIDQLTSYDGLCEKICLEITETAAISNLSQAIKFITILRGLGVRFALDDFGSGLSSFSYLKTLPVDYIKIDGMFVKDILDDDVDLAMVKSIHDIASVMNLKTIAEFVENDDILYELEQIGIDYAQGYGVGKPIPILDIIQSEMDTKPNIKTNKKNIPLVSQQYGAML